MYYFCTYFDHRYLPKGLALYHSLKQHCPTFQLWVLCLSAECYHILNRLHLPEVKVIRLEEFEQGDWALQEAKKNRTLVEYYFTCTPSLPLYIFHHAPEIDLITYLDADLFFFSDLNPIYQEIGQHSVAIISHRFSPKYLHMQIFGIYNVGWLSFRKNVEGLTCLRWWREQCLEWCHDRPENGRFADQKYLDDWPTRFQNVIVLQHKGINVARWNLDHYTLYEKNTQFWVDEQRLIFFHFHGVSEVEEGYYAANIDAEQFVGTVREIFIHYFQVINDIKQQLLPLFPEISLKESVRGQNITAQVEGNPMETHPTIVQEVINLIDRAVSRANQTATLPSSSPIKKENISSSVFSPVISPPISGNFVPQASAKKEAIPPFTAPPVISSPRSENPIPQPSVKKEAIPPVTAPPMISSPRPENPIPQPSVKKEAIPSFTPPVISPPRSENPTFQPSIKKETFSSISPRPPSPTLQSSVSTTKENPPAVALLIMQAPIMQLIQGQQLAQAIQMLEEQIRQQPHVAAAYNDLGVLLFHRPETRQEGVNHLERAIWLAPTEAVIQKNLAQVYMLSNRGEEALEMFNRFLNQFPHDIESLVKSAELCVSLGREARPFWERVLRLEPNHTEATRALR